MKKQRGESIFDFLHLKTTFRTEYVLMLLFWENGNKICFKIRFPFAAHSENSWPFDKFKVSANFVFQVVSKIEKRKTEIDD